MKKETILAVILTAVIAIGGSWLYWGETYPESAVTYTDHYEDSVFSFDYPVDEDVSTIEDGIVVFMASLPGGDLPFHASARFNEGDTVESYVGSLGTSEYEQSQTMIGGQSYVVLEFVQAFGGTNTRVYLLETDTGVFALDLGGGFDKTYAEFEEEILLAETVLGSLELK